MRVEHGRDQSITDIKHRSRLKTKTGQQETKSPVIYPLNAVTPAFVILAIRFYGGVYRMNLFSQFLFLYSYFHLHLTFLGGFQVGVSAKKLHILSSFYFIF